jgi:hypothetical protein
MALPVVLAHKDFGDFNILVHPDTSKLRSAVLNIRDHYAASG